MANNIAEQATGCVAWGKLNFQTKDGKISIVEAKKRLWMNEEVAVPTAGAGSYDEIFKLLGFTEVKVLENGSSAGDWMFAVKDKTGWRAAWQENRYPYHGYKYAIDLGNWGFETLDGLINFIDNNKQ